MTAAAASTAGVVRVRAEYEKDQIGIGTGSPRLSWVIDPGERGWSQSGYEVELAGRQASATTGLVASDRSTFVEWPFDPLVSRERVRIRVRCTGASGDTTEWSEWLAIEAGLLSPGDWTATPIAADAVLGVDPLRPVRFRREFEVRSGLVLARMYVSALGLYEAECNGEVVGDHVFAPGWTSYNNRLLYQTFDVTAALAEGANALGITVAEGWYRGRLGFRGGERAIFGDTIGPIAQLELRYPDGIETMITDESWRAAHGPMLSASIYDGEHYDARLDEPGWSRPGFDDHKWFPVAQLPSVADHLVAPPGPPVRRVGRLTPVAITTAPSGATLVDFGQNISGRVRLSVEGDAGTKIRIRHAEVLEDGELCVRPLRGAAATDSYILAGDGIEAYEPTFTIHGFRYAEITGWPGDITAANVHAEICHSDMEPTGTFRTSHAALQQLHDNIVWSVRGNFVSVPTDCPQRDERLGWLGDLQIVAPAASFLYDCNGFLSSWLEDIAMEQAELGAVPHYVPWIQLHFAVEPMAAWGDAAVIVPLLMVDRYGDVDLLRRQYDSMTAHVDQLDGLADERGIWNCGFQFGDWLDPTAPPHDPADVRTDTALVATAYYAHSTRLVARAANILGLSDDEARYDQRADRVVAAFNAEFVTPNGRLTCDSQTAYALALEFDLLTSQSQRSRAADRLAELVAKADHRIGTGFIGTPLICDALANNGYLDTAYHLLLQDQPPSWLYAVSMGATTVWERWDSMLPDGSINPGQMTSFNHYALGAIADFLHRVVAGISPIEPGYRRIIVKPRPSGGLTSAGATVQTPFGTASVDWTRVNEHLDVDIVVPAGCTAVVELPGVDTTEVGPGHHRLTGHMRPPESDPERPSLPAKIHLGETDDPTKTPKGPAVHPDCR